MGVANYLRTVIIRHVKEPPYVAEGHHYFHGMSTQTEGNCRPSSVILLCQNPLPSLHYTCIQVSGRVDLVECIPRHKHVAVWSTGLGAVTFLQDQYPVPYMAVYKVNPEVGAIFAHPLQNSTRHTTNLDALRKYTI